MSMKRFGRGAWRIATELAIKARLLPQRTSPTALRKLIAAAQPKQTSRNAWKFVRLLWRNQRTFVRPLVTITHHRYAANPTNWRSNFSRFSFRTQLVRPSVIERIRDVFGTNARYNPALNEEEYPEQIDAYDIGNFIAKGANGAVYSLKVRDRNSAKAALFGHNPDPGLSLIPAVRKIQEQKKFGLALKLMFNYDHTRREESIWREWKAELVPWPGSAVKLRGKFGKFHSLPSSHPNIVRLHTAFVDRMPILPDAIRNYPEAVPPIDIEARTLFIVMRRYRTTLFEYNRVMRKPNSRRSVIMLAQLLEGIEFLHRNCVAQRDMKSDNILLEFDRPDDVPFLVISDFGCALAIDSWSVDFVHGYETLGGNLATRAPEIRATKPGRNTTVNFSSADIWAAGTLTYEIFGRQNPFYYSLMSDDYLPEHLPELPLEAPLQIKQLHYDMLCIDPSERVKPAVAANVVALSLLKVGFESADYISQLKLFGIEAGSIPAFIGTAARKLVDAAEKSLDNVLLLVAAETIVSKLRTDISQAEAQVRATFLSRLQRSDVWHALRYFAPSN